MAWKDFEKETTEDLIDIIQMKTDPSLFTEAEDAFRAFTYRFQKDLLKKLIPVCRSWKKDKTEAVELGYLTFDQFWKLPMTFDKKECKKEIDKCVVNYLMRIAQHLLCGQKRDMERTMASPYNGDELIIREWPEIDVDQLSAKPEKKKELLRIHELIKNALEHLPPKHKIIYLTYKAYEKDGYKLPRKLLQSLRDELDLTQNSVKAYKNDAYKQIDNYLKLYGSK